jgi:rhodanese-related sulfurtransferase
MGNNNLHHLDNQGLKRFLERPEPPLVLDVRTPEEYDALGHIPGSVLIPTYELPARLSTLNPVQPVVVVCEHGVRSVDACYYLLQNAFQSVYNLQQGMAFWDGERTFS